MRGFWKLARKIPLVHWAMFCSLHHQIRIERSDQHMPPLSKIGAVERPCCSHGILENPSREVEVLKLSKAQRKGRRVLGTAKTFAPSKRWLLDTAKISSQILAVLQSL